MINNNTIHCKKCDRWFCDRCWSDWNDEGNPSMMTTDRFVNHYEEENCDYCVSSYESTSSKSLIEKYHGEYAHD